MPPPIFDPPLALRVRARYSNGETVTGLAEVFGVAPSTIRQVIAGRVSPVKGMVNLSRGRGRPKKGKST